MLLLQEFSWSGSQHNKRCDCAAEIAGNDGGGGGYDGKEGYGCRNYNDGDNGGGEDVMMIMSVYENDGHHCRKRWW